MNWLEFALNIALPILQAALTASNPGLVSKEKPILLKIRDAINSLFPGE